MANDGMPASAGAPFGSITVIQALLLFGFGFLSAFLLALLVAPAFWRRAVRLTERRIQATVPLTMNEIQAEKDGLRAEFAMSIRRLEMKAKSLQDRVAEQMIEIERVGEELRQVSDERDVVKGEAAAFEAKKSELEAALEKSEAERQALSAKLDELGQQMAGKEAEISRLDLAATDANLEVGNRQIELAAREAEIAKLKGDLGRQREQRRESEERLRAMALDNKSGRAALKTERQRAAELERRLEKAFATIADHEEALGRRNQAGQVAKKPTGAATADKKAGKGVVDADGPPPAPPVAAVSAEQQEALDRLASERKRLEERLTTLTRENRRLRTVSLAPPEDAPALTSGDAEAGETGLREQISNLAAEMVALTAIIEGPDSPIDKVLATAGAERPGGPPSLAERVRALREAARQR